MSVYNFEPDFNAECHNCGSSPCVVVKDHLQPKTFLCGPCFFHDREMVDWSKWNDPQEATE